MTIEMTKREVIFLFKDAKALLREKLRFKTKYEINKLIGVIDDVSKAYIKAEEDLYKDKSISMSDLTEEEAKDMAETLNKLQEEKVEIDFNGIVLKIRDLESIESDYPYEQIFTTLETLNK